MMKEALDFANKLRAKLGSPTLAEMPMGEREEPKSCPLANAFNFDFHLDGSWCATPTAAHAQALFELCLEIGERDVTLEESEDYGWKVDGLPHYIPAFVSDFDQGMYPEYDITPRDEEEFLAPDPDDLCW
jgi:hypothetical protein